VDDNLVVLFVQMDSSAPYITSTHPAAGRLFKEFVRPHEDTYLSVEVYPDVGVITLKHLDSLVEYLENLTFKVYVNHQPSSFFWELRNLYG